MSLKLWFCHLNADDGCESLAEVFSGNFNLGLLYLLGYLRIGIGIVLQYTCQRRTETSQVSTSFNGVDIVDVRMNILRVVGVVHDSHFDRNALLLSLQVDFVIKQMGAMTVNIAHEFLQSVLGMKYLFACLAFVIGAQVAQGDLDAGIKECQFSHTTGDDVPLIDGCSEDGAVWPELLARTAFIGVTYDLYRIERNTPLILLLVYLTIAIHLRQHAS